MINQALKLLVSPLSRRVFYWLWIAILLVHVPALVRDWKLLFLGCIDELRVFSFIALNFSTLFFAFKIRGVRWLEFNKDPRSIFALCLFVGIIHANAARESSAQPFLSPETQVVASVLFAASFTHVQRFLGRIFSATRSRRPRLLQGWGRTCDQLATLQTRLNGLLIPRAPPT